MAFDLSQLGRRTTPILYVNMDGPIRVPLPEDRPISVTDVQVHPDAAEALARWRRAGGRVMAFANHGGIALGHYDLNAVLMVAQVTVKLCGGVDYLAWCGHHPDAEDPSMARCWCRVPRPGLMIEHTLKLAEKHRNETYLLHEALYVGDTDDDRACAATLGVDYQPADEWWATVQTSPV